MKKLTLICCLLVAVSLLLISCDSSDEDPETPENTPVAAAAEISPVPSDTPSPEPTETVKPAETAQIQESEGPRVDEPESIVLESVDNELMGISVLVPKGWTEAAPGVYTRGNSITDATSLIQQAAAGMGVDELSSVLLQQLGIDALPADSDTYESDSFTWDLYVIDVDAPPIGIVTVDIALAESDEGSYIVLLQTAPPDYELLHEEVFLPAVDAFELLGTPEGETQQFEDPNGLFTVPVPTNWTAEESDGFVTLSSPEEDIEVHILVVEGDEPAAAIADAWEIVDPEFDRAVNNVTDVPPSTVGGVDEYVVVDYEWDEGEQPIIQAEARLFGDQVYVLIYVLELEAAQQRSSQIQIISSGFTINDLETKDLTGVDPLPFDGEIVSNFESFVNEKMENFDVPGASVAVVQDGQLVYANGFGVQNHESGEPVTPETMMMIGSTTKSLTTMLMAQLVDEGVFDWDTRVVEILPTFEVAEPDITDQITMQNLVCACTGVPRRDLEWLFNYEDLTAEKIIESLADFEFFTGFGEAFQYSNQMVATGGYLAALAAGGEYGTLHEDYITLLEERVLDPIGMEDSTFSFDEISGGGRYASPYGKNLAGETVEIPLSYETSLIPLAPAGALWSNVIDMSNYLVTLLQEGVSPAGERLVSSDNLAVTWEPQVEISAEADYGLGWIIADYGGLEIISHGGNTFGYSSEFAFAPSANLGVSILTNQQGSLFNPIVRMWLFEKLYQQEPETEELAEFLLQQSDEGLSSIRRSLVDAVDQEVVQDYLGSYEEEALGKAVLEWEDGKLILDVGEYRNEIRALRDDGEIEYSTYSPPFAGLPIRFELDEDGNPTVILGIGLVEYTFHRTG